MTSITIRKVDETTWLRLRILAATHDRSMEEEAYAILRAALAEPSTPENLASAVRKRFARFGGVDLEHPARGAIREPELDP